MIGRPNAQNKARKGVLRQRQGGARRERFQKQIFFRGRGQTLKPPQSRPTTARQEAPQEPPKKNNSVGNRGAPTTMRRGEFADSLFPRQLSAAGFRAGHAAAPRRMRPPPTFPRPSPTRAPRVPSPPPPQKKPELKIGAAPIWRRGRRERSDAGLARERCANHSIRLNPRPIPDPAFGDGLSVAI